MDPSATFREITGSFDQAKISISRSTAAPPIQTAYAARQRRLMLLTNCTIRWTLIVVPPAREDGDLCALLQRRVARTNRCRAVLDDLLPNHGAVALT